MKLPFLMFRSLSGAKEKIHPSVNTWGASHFQVLSTNSIWNLGLAMQTSTKATGTLVGMVSTSGPRLKNWVRDWVRFKHYQRPPSLRFFPLESWIGDGRTRMGKGMRDERRRQREKKKEHVESQVEAVSSATAESQEQLNMTTCCMSESILFIQPSQP